MNFEEMLKKQKENSFEKIVSAANAEQSGTTGKDERIWRPTVDKAGNGFSIVRFLPAPDSEIPWSKYYDHGFKGDSGKWYIEACPTTLKQPCPVDFAFA